MIKHIVAGLAIATLAIPHSVEAEVKGNCYKTHGGITVCGVKHGESDWYSIAAYDPNHSEYPAVLVVDCSGQSNPSMIGWTDWDPKESKSMSRAFCEDLKKGYHSPGAVLS